MSSQTRNFDAIRARDVVEQCIARNSIGSYVDLEKVLREVSWWVMRYAHSELGFRKPEEIIPTMALVLNAWSSWILESKNTCHYRRAGYETSYRELRDWYFTNLIASTVTSRNAALVHWRSKRQAGDLGRADDIPANIPIPDDYTNATAFDISQP